MLKLNAGFTLVELLIVMVIISIVVGLVAVASVENVRLAEKRATQGLISKLNIAVADRVDALMAIPVEPNPSHRYMAAISINPSLTPVGSNVALWGMPSEERARVIARFDFMRMEMPDVFFVQVDPSGTVAATTYPFNFAALPYPDPTVTATPFSSAAALNQYILPIGNSYLDTTRGPYVPGVRIGPATQVGPGACMPNPSGGAGLPPYVGPWIDAAGTFDPRYQIAGTGIFGASYAAAAGLYKQLGYAPQGYDGIDNNGNFYVDEWAEGVLGRSAAEIQEIQLRLSRHRHETARSEMLYALLVEGRGPLGSVFRAEDFTENEVMDTDDDGLMEFVDAWKRPIQFFRWPVFYPSDVQNGAFPYGAIGQEREKNPLDPNLHLMNPAWWDVRVNIGDPAGVFTSVRGADVGTSSAMSPRGAAFQALFGPLADNEFLANGSATPSGARWDRSGDEPLSRRSYFSKFLIVSSGPDEKFGMKLLHELYPTFVPSTGAASPQTVSRALLGRYAGQFPYATEPVGAAPSAAFVGESNAALVGSTENPGAPSEDSLDNITNHAAEPSGGGLF